MKKTLLLALLLTIVSCSSAQKQKEQLSCDNMAQHLHATLREIEVVSSDPRIEKIDINVGRKHEYLNVSDIEFPYRTFCGEDHFAMNFKK